MSALDALHSVRYVTAEGKRFAVIPAEEWRAVLEWLETLEDARIVREAREELYVADGTRARAGWLEWDAIRQELQ